MTVLDAETISGAIIFKAMERIAVLAWMSTEHEEKTLQGHCLTGGDSLAYHMIKTAKQTEVTRKVLEVSGQTEEIREEIQQTVSSYLLAYSSKIGKKNWMKPMEDQSSTALLLPIK